MIISLKILAMILLMMKILHHCFISNLELPKNLVAQAHVQKIGSLTVIIIDHLALKVEIVLEM